MAFNKRVPTDYGVDANYWRIISGNIDYVSGSLHLTVLGYLSKDVRDQGGSPLAARSYTFLGDEFAEVAEPTRALLYDVLMGMPEWAGAEEV